MTSLYGLNNTTGMGHKRYKKQCQEHRRLKRGQRKCHTRSLDVFDNTNQGVYIYKRFKVITAKQLKKEVRVYNGRRHIPIKITEEKLGRKYAEFTFTKRMGNRIHAAILQKRRRR